jgi:hypothetical protein
VTITTDVVSSNSAHGEVYSIQHYVIQFVSDLRKVGGFSGTLVPSTNKTDSHDITEILLKVVLTLIIITSLSNVFLSIPSMVRTVAGVIEPFFPHSQFSPRKNG